MIFDILALQRKVITMYPYFGGFAANLEYLEKEQKLPIMRDGDIISYDPIIMAELSENDRLFLLAHELCHIALEHDARGYGKEIAIWETAADAVVNQLLKRDGLEIVKGGVDHPEALEYDAEQYYEFLLEEKLAMDLIGGTLEGQETPLGDNDTHREESDDDIDSEGEEFEIRQDPTQSDDNDRQEDEDTDEDEYVLVEKTESEAGNSIDRDIRDVSEIGSAAPIIDWRMLLQDSVNYDVDWSYKNAVIDDNVVRPTLQEITVPETEIVVDTSWSVDEDLLRRFLRECKNILQISKLKVGCFDTVFYGFHDIRTEKDIDEMVFEGGGGTDFDVAINAFSLRADNRIIFTDGQAPMPEKDIGAIWVVYDDEKIEVLR